VFLSRRIDGEVVASENVVSEDGFFGYKEVPGDGLQIIFDHLTYQYDRRALRRGALVRTPGAPWKDQNGERYKRLGSPEDPLACRVHGD
jgi:hypothetical protein